MKQSTATQNTRKQSDVRTGIALAVSAFTISIFLYFQPQYFGALTTPVAIALIILGFAGLGIELDKIVIGKEVESLIDREKGPGVFDNLGIGIALLVVWGTLYRYFSTIWVNVLTSPVLLFGTYGTVLGLVNVLFLILVKSSDKAASPQNEPDRPGLLAIKVISAIPGVLGFIASLIQILQFFGIIP
ncbi:MAG: hypothetical protein DRO11_04420 [Methanobacteriota archaeon]|nr:MAG: hypothetical protein DRO11_04420 [Euryarchaeota archaeon]